MGWCCLLNDFLKTMQEGLMEGDQTVIGILVAVLVVLLTIFVLFLRGGSSKRRGVLLLGLCDSGKTVIFSKLVYKKLVQTYTSMKENSGIYEPGKENGGKSVPVTDVPGHERVRQKFWEQYKSSAKGLVFVIDSLAFQKEIKDVADFLYTVLADQAVSHSSIPVLVACNKQDQTRAKGAKIIQAQLEKEMTTVRMTKAATLQATDSSDSGATFLGKKNKDFEFNDVKNKVSFVECFTQGKGEESDLKQLESWIAKMA